MGSNNLCFFEDEVEQLRKSIESKKYDGYDRSTIYAAIRSLIPDYAGTDNPLDDKKFVAAIKEKYSKADPDPFKAFLGDAQTNLPDKYKAEDGSIVYVHDNPFKYEWSQYGKNREKNKDLVNENLEEMRPLSEKLRKEADRTVNFSRGGELLLGFILYPFHTSYYALKGGTLLSTASTSEKIDDIVYFQNPSLEKLAAEITRNKEQLIKKLPDESLLVERLHENLMNNIKGMNPKVSRLQSGAEFFEKQRVKNGEPLDGESDFNRELSNNSINEIKKKLNDYVDSNLLDSIYIKHDDTEKKIVFSLLPKNLDLGAMVMTDIRGKKEEKKNVEISGGTDVDFNNVTAQNHACVKPAALQQPSK